MASSASRTLPAPLCVRNKYAWIEFYREPGLLAEVLNSPAISSLEQFNEFTSRFILEFLHLIEANQHRHSALHHSFGNQLLPSANVYSSVTNFKTCSTLRSGLQPPRVIQTVLTEVLCIPFYGPVIATRLWFSLSTKIIQLCSTEMLHPPKVEQAQASEILQSITNDTDVTILLPCSCELRLTPTDVAHVCVWKEKLTHPSLSIAILSAFQKAFQNWSLKINEETLPSSLPPMISNLWRPMTFLQSRITVEALQRLLRLVSKVVTPPSHRDVFALRSRQNDTILALSRDMIQPLLDAITVTSMATKHSQTQSPVTNNIAILFGEDKWLPEKICYFDDDPFAASIYTISTCLWTPRRGISRSSMNYLTASRLLAALTEVVDNSKLSVKSRICSWSCIIAKVMSIVWGSMRTVMRGNTDDFSSFNGLLQTLLNPTANTFNVAHKEPKPEFLCEESEILPLDEWPIFVRVLVKCIPPLTSLAEEHFHEASGLRSVGGLELLGLLYTSIIYLLALAPTKATQIDTVYLISCSFDVSRGLLASHDDGIEGDIDREFLAWISHGTSIRQSRSIVHERNTVSATSTLSLVQAVIQAQIAYYKLLKYSCLIPRSFVDSHIFPKKYDQLRLIGELLFNASSCSLVGQAKSIHTKIGKNCNESVASSVALLMNNKYPQVVRAMRSILALGPESWLKEVYQDEGGVSPDGFFHIPSPLGNTALVSRFAHLATQLIHLPEAVIFWQFKSDGLSPWKFILSNSGVSSAFADLLEVGHESEDKDEIELSHSLKSLASYLQKAQHLGKILYASAVLFADGQSEETFKIAETNSIRAQLIKEALCGALKGSNAKSVSKRLDTLNFENKNGNMDDLTTLQSLRAYADVPTPNIEHNYLPFSNYNDDIENAGLLSTHNRAYGDDDDVDGDETEEGVEPNTREGYMNSIPTTDFVNFSFVGSDLWADARDALSAPRAYLNFQQSYFESDLGEYTANAHGNFVRESMRLGNSLLTTGVDLAFRTPATMTKWSSCEWNEESLWFGICARDMLRPWIPRKICRIDREALNMSLIPQKSTEIEHLTFPLMIPRPSEVAWLGLGESLAPFTGEVVSKSWLTFPQVNHRLSTTKAEGGRQLTVLGFSSDPFATHYFSMLNARKPFAIDSSKGAPDPPPISEKDFIMRPIDSSMAWGHCLVSILDSSTDIAFMVPDLSSELVQRSRSLIQSHWNLLAAPLEGLTLIPWSVALRYLAVLCSAAKTQVQASAKDKRGGDMVVIDALVMTLKKLTGSTHNARYAISSQYQKHHHYLAAIMLWQLRALLSISSPAVESRALRVTQTEIAEIACQMLAQMNLPVRTTIYLSLSTSTSAYGEISEKILNTSSLPNVMGASALNSIMSISGEIHILVTLLRRFIGVFRLVEDDELCLRCMPELVIHWDETSEDHVVLEDNASMLSDDMAIHRQRKQSCGTPMENLALLIRGLASSCELIESMSSQIAKQLECAGVVENEDVTQYDIDSIDWLEVVEAWCLKLAPFHPTNVNAKYMGSQRHLESDAEEAEEERETEIEDYDTVGYENELESTLDKSSGKERSNIEAWSRLASINMAIRHILSIAKVFVLALSHQLLSPDGFLKTVVPPPPPVIASIGNASPLNQASVKGQNSFVALVHSSFQCCTLDLDIEDISSIEQNCDTVISAVTEGIMDTNDVHDREGGIQALSIVKSRELRATAWSLSGCSRLTTFSPVLLALSSLDVMRAFTFQDEFTSDTYTWISTYLQRVQRPCGELHGKPKIPFPLLKQESLNTAFHVPLRKELTAVQDMSGSTTGSFQSLISIEPKLFGKFEYPISQLICLNTVNKAEITHRIMAQVVLSIELFALSLMLGVADSMLPLDPAQATMFKSQYGHTREMEMKTNPTRKGMKQESNRTRIKAKAEDLLLLDETPIPWQTLKLQGLDIPITTLINRDLCLSIIEFTAVSLRTGIYIMSTKELSDVDSASAVYLSASLLSPSGINMMISLAEQHIHVSISLLMACASSTDSQHLELRMYTSQFLKKLVKSCSEILVLLVASQNKNTSAECKDQSEDEEDEANLYLQNTGLPNHLSDFLCSGSLRAVLSGLRKMTPFPSDEHILTQCKQHCETALSSESYSEINDNDTGPSTLNIISKGLQTPVSPRESLIIKLSMVPHSLKANLNAKTYLSQIYSPGTDEYLSLLETGRERLAKILDVAWAALVSLNESISTSLNTVHRDKIPFDIGNLNIAFALELMETNFAFVEVSSPQISLRSLGGAEKTVIPVSSAFSKFFASHIRRELRESVPLSLLLTYSKMLFYGGDPSHTEAEKTSCKCEDQGRLSVYDMNEALATSKLIILHRFLEAFIVYPSPSTQVITLISESVSGVCAKVYTILSNFHGLSSKFRENQFSLVTNARVSLRVLVASMLSNEVKLDKEIKAHMNVQSISHLIESIWASYAKLDQNVYLYGVETILTKFDQVLSYNLAIPTLPDSSDKLHAKENLSPRPAWLPSMSSTMRLRNPMFRKSLHELSKCCRNARMHIVALRRELLSNLREARDKRTKGELTILPQNGVFISRDFLAVCEILNSLPGRVRLEVELVMLIIPTLLVLFRIPRSEKDAAVCDTSESFNNMNLLRWSFLSSPVDFEESVDLGRIGQHKRTISSKVKQLRGERESGDSLSESISITMQSDLALVRRDILTKITNNGVKIKEANNYKGQLYQAATLLRFIRTITEIVSAFLSLGEDIIQIVQSFAAIPSVNANESLNLSIRGDELLRIVLTPLALLQGVYNYEFSALQKLPTSLPKFIPSLLDFLIRAEGIQVKMRSKITLQSPGNLVTVYNSLLTSLNGIDSKIKVISRSWKSTKSLIHRKDASILFNRCPALESFEQFYEEEKKSGELGLEALRILIMWLVDDEEDDSEHTVKSDVDTKPSSQNLDESEQRADVKHAKRVKSIIPQALIRSRNVYVDAWTREDLASRKGTKFKQRKRKGIQVDDQSIVSDTSSEEDDLSDDDFADLDDFIVDEEEEAEESFDI